VKPEFLEPMEFTVEDVSIAEVSLKIGGSDYILKEANGGIATEYRNATMKGFILGENGKPVRIDGLASIEPLLVSRCLIKVETDGNRAAVPITTIKLWPAKVLKALYQRCKDISELTEEEATEEELEKQIAELQEKIETLREDAAGNEQSDTTGG
jgi:hypothetical protein